MKIAEISKKELAELSCIHEGHNYRLHLQVDSELNKSVIIKSLRSSASEKSEKRLINEYRHTNNIQIKGVRCACSKLDMAGRLALALDYVDGETLIETHVIKRHSLENNLEVAIAIAEVLYDMHRQHLIHRNLASRHILVTSQPITTTLIGFGDSSFEGESGHDDVELSTSMLAYISPEQTGRINRPVDHRADLYSFGAVLYELFTGKTPYETADATELIYAHLAQNPKSPLEHDPNLPKVVSDMIMRLLAKNPDERYQSAFGILNDLQVALKQLKQTKRIGEIVLAQTDYSSIFQISERIYGREMEFEILRTSIHEAEAGGVVLVSGRAGSGKSALVEELRSHATEHDVYFVAGSYQSSQRHVPYAGLRQAFDQWINLILTESPEQLARWKSELLDVCDGNAGLLIDMLPRLKLIIGQQYSSPEPGPTQTQHRFHNLLRSFVRVSARDEKPLVLFLDNLQWADQASIRLLELLLSNSELQPILFVAAYRDDEVGSEHQLTKLLDSLASHGSKVRSLQLKALPLDGVNRMIADALNINTATTLPLARLVMEKAGGNPLFVRQFLQSIYEKGLIVFDHDTHKWNWDTDAIQKRSVIGSVAELMAEKIGDLPEDTRMMLALAACIGIRFSTKTLAAVAELSVTDTIDRLQPAIDAGLLHRVSLPPAASRGSELGSDAGFEFPHDRVRQATYELLPQKQRRLNHLRVGQLLLSQTPDNLLQEGVFEIADQFNEGFEYLDDEDDRRRLISLNLMAGRKAKQAAAYLASIRYLSMGIGLLSSDCWKSRSEPTQELYIEAIEAEYLSANYERAALLSKDVLQHTNDFFTRLRVYELRILFLTAQSQIESSIEAGMEALEELGIVLSENLPHEDRQELTALTNRIKRLEQLPTMSDPRHLATLRILMHLAAPALRTNLKLLEFIIAKMVLLSVAHGNSPMAAFAYGWYGAILCGSVGGVKAGYRFGQLSMTILNQFNASELEPRVTLLFNAYVRHWKEPVRDSIFRLQEVFQWGLETGDLEYTSMGAVHHCGYLLFTGWPLEAVRRKQQRYLETIDWWRLPFQGQLQRIWLQTTVNLCAINSDPSLLIGEFFDETKYVPKWKEENNALSMFCVLCSRTMLQYLFGDYRAAVASGKEAEQYEEAALGLYYRANFSFYYALSLLALNEEESGAEPSDHLNVALTHITRLRHWAVLSPMSFAHKLALVEAEQACARGENGKAIERYNEALRLVRKYDNLMDEAVICEREAVFYRKLGRDDIADISLRNALDSYRSWGAMCKVDVLEHRFKRLIHHDAELIDTAAILKTSHILSQEVHLEQLLEKLMRIAIEYTGAEKGVLIQKKVSGLMVYASAVGDELKIMQNVAVDSSNEVAHSVVNYVAHTSSEVVLADASHDPTFSGDSHIDKNRVRSLLCLPILYQGRLSGLLYLENNLASDVFTEDRIELLKALVSQAAISMENATLYEELENTIAELRESEQKFRVIFDQTFQFIGVMDTNGTLLQANKSSLQFAGIDENEVLGKPFWETPWWNHSKELQEKLKQAVHDAVKGELVRFEATHVSSDGQISHIDFSLKPITDSQGKVVLLIPEGRDITQYKRTEEEVALLSFALDKVHEAAFLIDEDAHFRFVNEEACRSLGYTREELLALSVDEVDPDRPKDRWPQHWRELRDKGSLVFQGRHRTKNGRIIPVEICANYIKYGQEELNLALVRNISERK